MKMFKLTEINEKFNAIDKDNTVIETEIWIDPVKIASIRKYKDEDGQLEGWMIFFGYEHCILVKESPQEIAELISME